MDGTPRVFHRSRLAHRLDGKLAESDSRGFGRGSAMNPGLRPFRPL